MVFIYGRAVGEIGLEGLAEAAARLKDGPGPTPLLIGAAITPEAAVVFDGLHTYHTAGHLRGKEPDQVRSWAAKTHPAWVQTARQAGRISTPTVIPGYDDTNIRKPGLAVGRFDGEVYNVRWEAAISAAPDWMRPLCSRGGSPCSRLWCNLSPTCWANSGGPRAFKRKTKFDIRTRKARIEPV